LGDEGGKVIAVCSQAVKPNDGGSWIVGGLNLNAGQVFHGRFAKKSENRILSRVC
jgi:hypothetical protein